MAGVFKSLDKSDVRLTPFRAYKQWSDTISYCNYSASLGTLTTPTTIVLAETGTHLVIANTTDYAVLDPTNENLENLSGTESAADTPILKLFKHPTTSSLVIALSDKFSIIDTITYTSAISSSYPGIDLAYDTVNNQYLLISGSGLNHGRLTILDSSYTFQATTTDVYRYIKVDAEAYNQSGGTHPYYYVLSQDTTGGVNNGSWIITYDTTAAIIDKNIITTETGAQDLVYGSNQSGYYCLINNKLYFKPIPSPSSAILVALNVAAVLSDVDNAVHAVLQNGDILVDIVTSGTTVTYDTIQGSSYAGSNTATQAVVNSNNEIGILAGSVFYIYNVNTNTFKDPKYIPASTTINKIYSDKDITTRIYGIGSGILMNLSCEPDDFTLFRADYSGRPYYLRNNPLDINFDQGNGPITTEEVLTADEKYERVVHKSIDHLFYRDYKTNTKATFGGANINYQRRSLNDRAYVLSLPQKNMERKFNKAQL